MFDGSTGLAWFKYIHTLIKNLGVFAGGWREMHRTRGEIMPPRVRQPVSQELVRIVRESSGLGVCDASLSRHMQAVEDRQAQALEFYLRACAMRLEDGE